MTKNRTPLNKKRKATSEAHHCTFCGKEDKENLRNCSLCKSVNTYSAHTLNSKLTCMRLDLSATVTGNVNSPITRHGTSRNASISYILRSPVHL